MLQVYLLAGILLSTIGLLIWGYWRYDIIALLALMTAVLTGVVPFDRAFTGFANPAVITVLCVMVITAAITQSGILEHVIKRITPVTQSQLWHVAILTLFTAMLSAFMNNVGALALMMPVAIQTSIAAKRSPSLVLMPLAFGSVLGGLLTAIGTPPNLLISDYRLQVLGKPFSMFAFTPVGIVAACAGLGFIILFSWRLLPERKAPTNADDMFQMQDYITEVKIPPDSPVAGKTLQELEHFVAGDFLIVGLVRGRQKRFAVKADELLQEKDILIVEAGHEELEKLISKGKLTLVTGETITSDILRSDKIALLEAVVPQASRVEGRSSQSMRLRSRHQLNLIAIAREGKPFKNRLNKVLLRAGDVVLLQGAEDTVREDALALGFLPLAERGVQVGLPRKAYMPTVIFAMAILLAALHILPVQISFMVAVLALVLLNIIPARKLYDHIDWPIIVLLGALIPIGGALQSTGATILIGEFIQSLAQYLSPVLLLALLFLITMTLSDVMNNAATAVVMAPIGVTMAQTLHTHIDPFLMTVAVAASCSFLTPISHQNNTLVMGPGGYKFFDYFRLGLPLELFVMIIAVPTIIWVWPL